MSRELDLPLLPFAFLDALGTSAAAMQPAVAKEKLTATIAATRAMQPHMRANDATGGIAYQCASDSIFIAARRVGSQSSASEALGKVIEAAAEAMAIFAYYGIFLRGGLTFGPLYVASNILWGSAVVEAAKLEDTTKQPRLALSPTAQALAESSIGATSDDAGRLLMYEGDVLFVDYLQKLRGDELFRVRDHIERWNADATRPDVASKAEWMRQYYNSQSTRPIRAKAKGHVHRFEKVASG
jgi:hypothetical protein